MQDFANISHPLKRDGRSVADRTLPVLDPSANPIDGRGWKELLFFLYQMSGWVKYYDVEMEASDWRAFLKDSTPVQLALISQFELKKVERTFSKLNQNILDNQDFSSVNALMDYSFEIIYLIENWRKDLARNDNEFATFLNNLIKSNLKYLLVDLVAIANAGNQWGYQSGRNNFSLTTDWNLSATDLFKTDDAVAQTKISADKRMEILEQKLQDLFRLLFKNLQQVVEKAPSFIEKSLDNRQNHTPHLGLLFAFIKLWKLLQNEGNRMTKRHLDFFYQQVLCIKKQAIVPDKAHLIFELSNKVEAQNLAEGFLFEGKDLEGNDVHFSLDEQVVIQKAQIADLRTLYLQLNNGKIITDGVTQQFCEVVECIFKAPIANSADGLGEGFKGVENPTWKTLGWPKSKQLITPPNNLSPYFQQHPFADFGFLLASQILFLQEGTRTVTITIKGDLSGVFHGNNIQFSQFQNALKANYFVITEDSLKVAIEQGMKPARAAYFEQFLGKAFNKTQLKKLIDNRQPVEDSHIDDYLYLTGTADRNSLGADFINLQIVRAFDLCFSGEKEWLFKDILDNVTEDSLNGLEITDDENAAILTFTVVLPADFDPITCYDAEVFGVDYNTELPVAKLVLNPSIKYEGFGLKTVSLYHIFRNFKVEMVEIKVAVDGICNLLVQNDDGVLDATKPFQPFGAIPTVGSNFYVGSAEVFSKNLTELDLNLTWKDLPSDWNKQYEGYTLPEGVESIDNTYFKTEISWLNNNEWGASKKNNLFDSLIPLFPDLNIEQDFTQQKVLTPYDFNSKNGFLKLELQSDFLHAEYPNALATQMLLKSDAEDPTTIPIPKPPYTPTLQKVSIDYTAVADHDTIDFIHLHPFEKTYEAKRLPTKYNPDNPLFLLPKFTDEGHLFIGLQDLEAGSNLNLLFQMVESTANPDLDKAVIKWSYLKDNKWGDLKADFDVLSDETNGLIQSGIVTIKIPWDITDDNTILPKDTFWLRISTAKNVAAIAETIQVYAQAARVTYVNEGVNLERLSEPLPQGSLTKSVQAVTTLQTINQAYDSFGGRAPETDKSYYRRVSERLRHKGRGITLFDYETLVLQEFPSIFKAKCITHTLGKKGANVDAIDESPDYELSPGFVTVAVIPDVSKLKIEHKTEPKATLAMLESIEKYLQSRISPFVRLKVLNPLFERISVKANVKFKKGVNESFYQKKLATDLEEFLAPWAFGGPSQISFGGKISKSAILNFIEKRDYVDYLTDLKMLDKLGVDFQEIFAKAARSILTTGKHQFTAIHREFCTGGNAQGSEMTELGNTPIGAEGFRLK